MAVAGAFKRHGNFGRKAVARRNVLQELDKSWNVSAGPAEAQEVSQRAPFLKVRCLPSLKTGG